MQKIKWINRTVHAAALSALVETDGSYRFYFGVYLSPVSRVTRVYLFMIERFRRLIAYPSLLRTIRARWDECLPLFHFQLRSPAISSSESLPI